MDPRCKAFLTAVSPEGQANLGYLSTHFHLTLAVLTTKSLVLLSLPLVQAKH